MFNRLKKVFGASADKPLGHSVATPDAASMWASAQRFAYSSLGEGKDFSMTGQVGSSPWRLERGHSSCAYILAAKSSGRALKDALEKQANQIYTDTRQTTAAR